MNMLNLPKFDLNKKRLSFNTLFAEKRLYLISYIPIKIIKLLMIWRILITSGFKRLKIWNLKKSVDKKTTKMVVLKTKINEKINLNYNQQKLYSIRNKLLKHKQLLKQNESINKSMLKYQFNSAVYYKITNFYWMLRQEKRLKSESELNDYAELLNSKQRIDNSLSVLEFNHSIKSIENSTIDKSVEISKNIEVFELESQQLDINEKIKIFQESYSKSVFLDLDVKITHFKQKHPTWSIDEIFQEYHIDFLTLMRRLWLTKSKFIDDTKTLNQQFYKIHTIDGFKPPKPQMNLTKLNRSINTSLKYKKPEPKTWKDIFHRKEAKINRWNYNVDYTGLSKNIRFSYKLALIIGFIIPLHYLLTGKWIQFGVRLIFGSMAWSYINSLNIDLIPMLNDIFLKPNAQEDFNLVLSIWCVTTLIVWDWLWLGLFKKFRNSRGYFVFRSTSYRKKYIDDMSAYIFDNPSSKIYTLNLKK